MSNGSQTRFLSANNDVLQVVDNAAEAGRWQNVRLPILLQQKDIAINNGSHG